jgi:Ca2+-binding RTX toxin-like protein
MEGRLVKGRICALALATVVGLMAQSVGSSASAAARCKGKVATKVGTSASETINGTKKSDVIVARGGNDFVNGKGGNDVICGGGGFDELLGGKGNDKLYGDADTDLLNGGAGNNTIDGGAAPDWAYYFRSSGPVEADLKAGSATGEGTDDFVSIEALYGSPFDDVLRGGDAADTIFGDAGNDTIDGGAGLLDFLAGDAGDDELIGGVGQFAFDVAYYRFAPAGVQVDLAAGTATGGAGNDTLNGFEGVWGSDFDDVLRGDDGKNPFAGSEGNDVIDGRGEFDVVIFWVSPDGVNVDLGAGTAQGEGSDTLTDIEGVSGSPFGDDTLVGDEEDNYLDGYDGNDTLSGLGGDDWLSGGAGNDQMDGGAGTYDLVEFYETAGVTANLGTGVATGEGNDTMSGIEALFGTPQDDHLTGDPGPNLFFGGSGNDTIDALAGDDFVDGGEGEDDIDGGDGTDNCASGAVLLACEGPDGPDEHVLFIDVFIASQARRNF